MIKVHVLYEHSGDGIPHGSSVIRLLRPLSHPKSSQYVTMTSGTSYEKINTDVIILDRLWKPGIKINDAERLVEYARKKGIILLYSLDDNLLDLKLNEPCVSHPTSNERNIIRYFVRESDGVIVSTPALRERIKNLNSKIVVIENALDERLFKNFRKKTDYRDKEKLTIGYMGTFTHDLDLYEILSPLKKILNKYNSKVKFEIIGALSNDQLLKLLPNSNRISIDGNYEYTQFWNWMCKNIFWDIGIAPLKINEFTRCKSDIKFLDYAALGVPGIFTRCPPYEFSIAHGKTGLIVENDNDSWASALETLICDDDLRSTLSSNAWDYLNSKRTLESCVFKWIDALHIFTRSKRNKEVIGV